MILTGASSLFAGSNQQQASEWQDAALSRRDTAMALQKQAADLLEQAQTWRKKAFLSDAERRRNFDRAGDAEFKAGEIAEAVALNFTKEAENWRRAADAFSAIPDVENSDTARRNEAAAHQGAMDSLKAASANFDLAAGAYGDANAGESSKASHARSKANAVSRRLAQGS